jgi:two-component system chemotaxis response regulator CheV
VTAEQDNAYVLFPMGARRFAFPADMVDELARPDHLQTFPHSTPLLAGVLVRRGKIVPVLDIAQLLVGPQAPPRKFYLITKRKLEAHREWTAIPVTGECELASLSPAPRNLRHPQYVTGLLISGEEIVEIVDLEKLMAEANP